MARGTERSSEAPTIYVDLDDVLSETIEPLMALADRLFGRKVAIDDVREFDLASGFSISEAQLAELMDAAHAPESLAGFVPKPGARAALDAWADAGYAVAVLTGRPPETAHVSRSWLAQHALPCHRFACVDKYGRWPGAAAAEDTLAFDAIAEQQFVLAVEDSAEMAVHLAEHCGVPVALIDRPWNRLLPPHGADATIVRCHGWSDVAQHFAAP